MYKTSTLLSNCNICPRKCNVNRLSGEYGFCISGSLPKLALASIHNWEEPSISGTKGSGTIFFSNCNMKCIFCQNFTISTESQGKDVTVEKLSDIIISQQNKNVHNINLVSATQYIPLVRDALILAKSKGLFIPVVYNTNGYENVESLKLLENLVNIYLPDLKYYNDEYSKSFSSTPNYFKTASNAIIEMFRQTGTNEFDCDGIMQKGVLIRHLILPGCKEDSKKILLWIKENLGDNVYVSLMNQYTPMYKAKEIKQLSRKLTTYEYENVKDYFLDIGLTNGYVQKKSAASSSFTPNFDLSGI